MFKPVDDIISYNLNVLFVGINPGIETAKKGFHFAHPSNRFWSTLYKSGFTKKLLLPSENKSLLQYGLGITNVVDRPTKSEREILKHEYAAGRIVLERKIEKFTPKWVAFIGIGLYRNTFNNKTATVGRQDNIHSSKVWVLPQPSGLNAHYPPDKLVYEYSKFYNEVD